MASPVDLVTLAQLTTFLNSNNASFNAGFTTQNGPLAITACSRDWLNLTGRRSLNRFVPFIDTYDGSGGLKQFLKDFPAALVSSVYVNGVAVSEGGFGNGNGTLTPGWVLDQKRESLSIIGSGPWTYGLGIGPGGAYAATGGPLTRVNGGRGFGMQNDRNMQNVQISYFGGGCIMFGETVQIEGGSISLSQAANFYTDLGVIYSLPQNGQLVPLESVAANPAQGQYTVSNIGAYGFNAADDGNYVAVTYGYNAAPEEIQGWALIQIAEMLEKRKQLGMKQQGGPDSGTTTYTWDVPRQPMMLQVALKYKRAFTGM